MHMARENLYFARQLGPKRTRGPFQSIPRLNRSTTLRAPLTVAQAGGESFGPMSTAAGAAGESSGTKTKTKKLKIAIIHPDLGIGTEPRPPPLPVSHRSD